MKRDMAVGLSIAMFSVCVFTVLRNTELIEDSRQKCDLPRRRNAWEPHRQKRGALWIRGGDFGAGWSTLFVLYPINHILIAEELCLLPMVSFVPKYTRKYPKADWHRCALRLDILKTSFMFVV
jgi:hypothetical protein